MIALYNTHPQNLHSGPKLTHMKTFKNLFVLCILLITCVKFQAKCQPIPIQDNENIINGKLWVPTILNSEGSQLFLGELQMKGYIRFDSVLYHGINLGYDLEQNEVLATIVTPNNTKRIIALNKSRLQEFSFMNNGQEFHFKKGDLIHPDLNPKSFYQVVSTYNLTYVIHREKQKVLKMKSRKYEYLKYNKLSIIKDNKIHSINKRKDLLNILYDQKTEIKKYIQLHKLKINSKHPMDIVPVILNFDL